MKAVILAAGKGTRMQPLTFEKPKPLLTVADKTLIEHNLEQLNGLVDEVIIVIGYKGEMIRKHLGDKFKDIKISHVEQKEQLGTGHAIMQAKDFVKGRFIVMMGDDLYFRKDIENCIKYDLSILVKKVKDPSSFGVIVKEGDKVKEIVEKPKEFVSDLANTALYVFDERLFSALENSKKSSRGEYELIDAVNVLASDITVVIANNWIPICYPEDLEKADKIMREVK